MFNFLLPLFMACEKEAVEVQPEPPKTEKSVKAPAPKRDPIVGEPRTSLLLSQAWFWTAPDGEDHPGPARLDIWRKTEEGWQNSRLEDPDSNVFHKTVLLKDGILTIGAMKAKLKKWIASSDGWKEDTLWEKSWGGKIDRLRDIEIGDVDGDGKDEYVIATHDYGVVAVVHPDEKYRVEEMDKKADTFVHEIEIGDIDGDGKMEFFATPSDRNTSTHSQGGSMVMYRWDGTSYVRTVVDPFGKTHAKEILAADIDGDNKSELFSVVEAEKIGNSIITPVEIRQYTLQPDGSFSITAIASIDDSQTRFLVPGDFNHDGRIDLVAAAMKSGIWLLKKNDDGSWTRELIDDRSSGFEHSCVGADLDGDGKLELYVAADDQGSLNRYIWDAAQSKFIKEKIGDIPIKTFTWNISTGIF